MQTLVPLDGPLQLTQKGVSEDAVRYSSGSNRNKAILKNFPSDKMCSLAQKFLREKWVSVSSKELKIPIPYNCVMIRHSYEKQLNC